MVKKKKKKALGRSKVIGKALEFKKETEFMQDLGIEAAEHYSIQFEDQDFLDFAAVVDLNRPIIVDGGQLSSNATEMIVLVSGYKILRKSKGLTFLATDTAARKALVGEVRWLKRCALPDIAEWIDESLFGCKIQRIRGANVCTGDTTMRPSFPCHGRKPIPRPCRVCCWPFPYWNVSDGPGFNNGSSKKPTTNEMF
jgi:hypothetical protein